MKQIADTIRRLVKRHWSQRLVTLPLVFAAVVANLVIYRLYSNHLENDFRYKGENLLAINTPQFAYSLMTGNITLTRQQLGSLLRHHNVVDATIYKPDGSIAFRVRKYRFNHNDRDRYPAYSRLIDARSASLTEQDILDGASTVPARILGRLEVILDRSPVRDSLRLAAMLSILIVISGLLITLILFNRRKKDLEHEITALESITSDYARGDFGKEPGPVCDRRFDTIHQHISTLGDMLRNQVANTYNNQSFYNEKFRNELEHFKQDTQVMAEMLEKLKHNDAYKTSVLLSLDTETQKGITRSIDLIDRIEAEHHLKTFSNDLKTIKSQLQLIRHAIRNVCQPEDGIQTEIDSSNIDLRKLVESALQISAPLCYDKKIELTFLLYEDVETKLVGPEIPIRDMLIDMISIARNHTSNGRVTIRVELEEETDESSTIGISVQDNGTGITLETQKKIQSLLKTGFPGWKPTDNIIDLPFINLYRLANRTGAGFEFKSMLGEGTTTKISLHLDKQPHVTAQKRHEVSHHAFKCLLYDAHDVSRSALSSMLQAVNMDITTTRHSDDIGNIANHSHDTNTPYQLIILSLDNDEMKIDTIRDMLADIRDPDDYIVVVLVNSVDPDFIKAVMELGPTHCFPKIVPHDVLIGKINSSFVLQGRIRNNAMRLQGAHVLVADDDSVSRIFAVSVLSNSGASVTESTNGDDAIELASKNEYDVIFMDIYMPGTNGIDAMRKIKNGNGKSSTTPVIALTSNSLYRQKSNCAKLGFDACLVKPIDNTTLLNITLSQLDLTDTRFHNMDFNAIRRVAYAPVNPGSRHLYDVEKALKITGGNAELADELFNSLLDELPEMKKKLNKAFKRKDYKNMESSAHKIHGAAAYCAVTSIKDLAGKLEKATIKNRKEEIDTYMKQLNNDIDRILDSSRRAAG